MLWEILLHCVVLPPRVDSVLETYMLGGQPSIHLSDWFFLISTLRVYHFFRMLYHLSPFSSPRTSFICSLHCPRRPLSFVVKSMLEARMFAPLLLAWLVLAGLCSICVHTLEREHRLSSLWSSLWAVLTAQVLTGYGDAVPATAIGRVTVFVGIVLGVGTLAGVVGTVGKSLAMGKGEELLASEVMLRRQRTGKIRAEAAKLVQRFYKLRLEVRENAPQTDTYRQRFNRQLLSFKLTRKSVESRRVVNFPREISCVGERIQSTMHSFFSSFQCTREIAHSVLPTQSYSAQLFAYTQYHMSQSVFHCAKQTRRLYMDSTFGPDYRERRGSTYSQRNSSASISSNLSRLKGLMAQDKNLRLLTGYETMGNSPRVSFEALRSVREDTSTWTASLPRV